MDLIDDESSLSTTNDIDEDPQDFCFNGLENHDSFDYHDGFLQDEYDIEILQYKAFSTEQALEFIEQSINEHKIIINHLIFDSLPYDISNPYKNMSLNSNQCLYLLQKYDWNISSLYNASQEYNQKNEPLFLIQQMGLTTISPHNTSMTTTFYYNNLTDSTCSICFCPSLSRVSSMGLPCGHLFCMNCWENYVREKLNLLRNETSFIDDMPKKSTNSKSSNKTSIYKNLNGYKFCKPWDIRCMQYNCNMVVTRDFVECLLTPAPSKTDLTFKSTSLLSVYNRTLFDDIVRVHPLLAKCPTSDCNQYFFATKRSPKKVTCHICKTEFCFMCREGYHAPSSCNVMYKWYTKCNDDSETSNYIRANTKDCPKCAVTIEKNGGCNHMVCFKCQYQFCWMCLQPWDKHGSQYYECTRYTEEQVKLVSEKSVMPDPKPNNGNLKMESQIKKSREALNKYLFHFSRWDNHDKSRKWEDENIKASFHEKTYSKILAKEGTWIDWEYLNEGANLLSRCRHTLQYAYPHAYFAKLGPEKNIFHTQHLQLEVELENLAWKLEKAEITDRADLENQMNIVTKRRYAMLKFFFETYEKDSDSRLLRINV